MIPAEQMARWLCEALLDKTNANNFQRSTSSKQFTHYEACVTVTEAKLMAYIGEQRGDREGLELIPLLQYIGRIKKACFEYFLASQEATLEKSGNGREGAELELRR